MADLLLHFCIVAPGFLQSHVQSDRYVQYQPSDLMIGAVSGITGDLSSYTSAGDAFHINTTAAIDTNDWMTQFDIALSLDSSWGFHPSNTSTLSMTINSDNSSDLIVSFSEYVNATNDDQEPSVGSWKWFSIFLNLNHSASDQYNRIYPSCVNHPHIASICIIGGNTMSTDDLTETLTECSMSGNRSCLFGGHSYEWLEAFYQNDCSLRMPVTITLKNDPKSKNMTITLDDGKCSEWYFYMDHFVGNNGLNIYLSMNSPYDSSIIIESFQFEYNVTESAYTSLLVTAPTEVTSQPTSGPTNELIAPTNEPSLNPTTQPTSDPAHEPTAAAPMTAVHPTITLTVIPTQTQTSSSSQELAPDESDTPSQEPTMTPPNESTTTTSVTTINPTITSIVSTFKQPIQQTSYEASISSDSTSNELIAFLLVGNMVILVVIGCGIMHYLRRRNSGSSSEITAGQMVSNESEVSKMEEQVEGAGQRDIDMSIEGKAAAEPYGNGGRYRGMPRGVFANDEVITDVNDQPTDQGDV